MTQSFLLLSLGLTLNACSGVRREVRRGDAALADGRSGAAVHAYRQALSHRPGDGRAQLGLARALLADRDYDAALAPARAAEAAQVAGADRVLVLALLAVGQGASAQDLARKIAEDDPKDPDALALRAEAALAAADLPTAVDAAHRLSAMKTTPRELSLCAWILSRSGDLSAAGALSSQAFAVSDADVEVQSEAAAIQLLSGDAATARAAAKEALAHGAVAAVFARDATRLDQGGDREGAIRRLSWATALEPDDGRMLASLGQLYLARSADERAAGLLERALALPPYKDPSVGGVTLARPGDWAEPTRRQKAAELSRALGIARANLGDARGAARAVQQAAELLPDEEAGWIAAADAWDKAHAAAPAIEALQRAVTVAPQDLATRLRLARALADNDQLSSAIGQARAAWEASPTSVEATLLLGSLYERRGEKQSARDLYTTVLRAHPTDSRLREALTHLGG